MVKSNKSKYDLKYLAAGAGRELISPWAFAVHESPNLGFLVIGKFQDAWSVCSGVVLLSKTAY